MENYFFTIWYKPRQTIQKIIDSNPRHLVWLLAALYGITCTIDPSMAEDMVDAYDLSTILIFAVLLGPFFGFLVLELNTILTYWVGKWIGGKASKVNIRAVYAWTFIPLILVSFIYISEIILLGDAAYSSDKNIIKTNVKLRYSYIGLELLEGILNIWYFFIVAKCVSQVQEFSLLKAIGNLFLMAIPIVVVFGFIYFWVY